MGRAAQRGVTPGPGQHQLTGLDARRAPGPAGGDRAGGEGEQGRAVQRPVDVGLGDHGGDGRQPPAPDPVAQARFGGAPEQECAAEEGEYHATRRRRRRFHPGRPQFCPQPVDRASQSRTNKGEMFDDCRANQGKRWGEPGAVGRHRPPGAGVRRVPGPGACGQDGSGPAQNVRAMAGDVVGGVAGDVVRTRAG